jgi:hypothetical protein
MDIYNLAGIYLPDIVSIYYEIFWKIISHDMANPMRSALSMAV